MPVLNDKTIRAMGAPDKGRKLVFDQHKDAPRGFGLKVTPKGKKVFVLRYNVEGKDRLMTVGDYGTWSLTAARTKATEYRRKIDDGADILQQRRTKRIEGTVGDMVDKWCLAHADKLKSGKAIRGTLERHLVPALGDRKITEVRRAEFIEVIAGLAESSPRQASLLLSYCKQMMTWCEDREIIEYNPIATLKAKNVAKGMTSKTRTRTLTDDEIRVFWNTKPDGMSRATWLALKFILTTGQRPGEVCLAEQSELKGNVWTIPKEHRGKTDDEQVVPLTDTALELIEQGAGKVHLFERYKGQSMDVNALAMAVRRWLGEDTPDRWKPHDLRRTMRTGLAAAKVQEVVAELTIGHVRKGIAGVYDHHRYFEEKRAALEAWERRLLLVLKGKPADASKVVSIKRA